MSSYKYYNSVGSKVETTSTINMIRRGGPMSFCGAVEVSDQHGCKYRRDASNAKHCRYFRGSVDGACDNIWAQQGITMPEEPKEDDDEAEQTIATFIPT